MTKKRFSIIGDSNIEYLMQSKLLLPIYDKGVRLSLKSCCDVLNAQHEEIEYWKKEAEEYNLDAMNYQTLYEQQIEKNNKLKNENEELKKLNIPINKIKDTIVDCRGRIIGVYYDD